jgi:hypothetical protein
MSCTGPHAHCPHPGFRVAMGELCGGAHTTAATITTTLDHFCAATTGAYTSLHHQIRNLLVAYGTLTGCVAVGEPSMDSHVLTRCTKPEVATLLPSGSANDRAVAHQLWRLKVAAEGIYGTAADRARALAAYREAVSRVSDDYEGIRSDVYLRSPDGAELLTDVSATHTTQASTLPTTDNFFRNLAAAELTPNRTTGTNPYANINSTSIKTRVQAKATKYKPLIDIMEHELATNKRSKRMQVKAAVFSNSGELAGEFIDTIEWMATHYARTLKSAPPTDGVTIGTHVTTLRSSIKDSIMVTIASGFGKLITAAGYACNFKHVQHSHSPTTNLVTALAHHILSASAPIFIMPG